VNPRLLVEVLSPSTELRDRTRKAEAFRQVPSLQANLLISQEEPRVEPYYRSSDGIWSFGTAVTDPGGIVPLPWIGIELPMAEVYARVVVPPTQSDAGEVPTAEPADR
jgi:Uma2 family endonuclease